MANPLFTRSVREWAFTVTSPAIFCVLGVISASADSSRPLESHLPPATARSSPLGRVPASQTLKLAISLPLRNQTDLMKFLSAVTDPKSPDYRHYLTPAQFTEKYGPTQSDYDAVIAFAKANGLTVTQQHPNRMLLDVAGPVPVVEKALHVKMWRYRHPQEARVFYAPDVAPTLNLSVPVLGVSGLSNYALPKPHYVKIKPLGKAPGAVGTRSGGTSGTTPETGTGPSGTYMGSDFRNAYVPGTSLNGSGQTVGLLQFDGYTTSDITYYEEKAGLPNVPLTNVLLDGFDGEPSGSEIEVSLDIEMSMSMAPGLSGIIVYEAGPNGDWHDILNRMADDDLAAQLSCSWYIPGGTMDATADQIFQQMQSQGQSFYCASGDSDAYTGLIPFPGDTPYITEVGGTTLNTTSAGGPYSSESAWNWGDGTGTGGGVSTQYSIPSWQQGIGMTSNLGSTTMRNTPDVALTGNQVYVRVDETDEEVGGTSCAAPLWAGFTALINQQASINGAGTVGFINPAIYALGRSGSYTSDVNDITSGNNYSTSSPSKFPAVTGYDLCTGWGTPKTALIAALAPQNLPAISDSATLPSAASGVAYNETLTATGGTPPYTWNVISGSPPSGLGLNGSTGAITGSTTAIGVANFTVQVTDSKGKTGSEAFTLNVLPSGTPAITTISPLPLASTAASYTQTFAAQAGAPSYSWSMTSGSVPGLNLNGSTGVLSGTPTTAGTYSFNLQVTDSNNASSTSPFTVTVSSPPSFTVASTLPSGIVNVAYGTLLATTAGGTFPYTFTMTSGSLPSGLKMAANGYISGTPKAAGTSNFSVTVKGSNGLSSTRTFSLTIAPYGSLDHFAWSTISSPQQTNSAFPVTIMAQDNANNTVGNFTSTVSLTNPATNTILNSPTPDYEGYGNWTLGYSFVPSTTITAYAVRSYSGSLVSIWTSGGTLLESVAVNGTEGIWTQTALPTPVTLQAGTTYVVSFYTNEGDYYWSGDLPSTFSAGTIISDYYSSGNTFPTTPDSEQWWFVDLAYSIGPSVSLSPASTGKFSSGIWTGTLTAGAVGTGATIVANDGAGHSGVSNVFNVIQATGQAPAFTNSPLSTSTLVDQSFTFTYTASGAPSPTFALFSGAFPQGLNLSSSGSLAGTPTQTGVFSGTVDAANGVGMNPTQAFSLTVLNTFANWESQYFTALQLTNPAMTGQTADPGNDGVPNLLKYLFDINPTVSISTADRAALPQVSIVNVSSTNYLVLTFRENSLAGGITVSVQTSPDLVNWTTVTPVLNTSTPIPSTNDTTVQVGVPASSSPMLYIRLRVTSP